MFSCVVLPGPRASELMPSAQNACETRPRGIWQTAWGGGGSPVRQLAGAGVKVASKLADSSRSQAQPLHVASSCRGVFPPGLGRGGGSRRRCGHLGLEEAEEGAGQHAHITAAGSGGNCLTPLSRPGDTARSAIRGQAQLLQRSLQSLRGGARRPDAPLTETVCPRPFFPPPREADH